MIPVPVLQQYDTAKAIPFLMVLSSDKSSPATGKSPTVTLSKNGGSFVSATGTVSELANGWYKLAPSAADVSTTGMLIVHAEAASCENVDDKWWVSPDRGYLLCSSENQSAFNSASSTQFAFSITGAPSAHAVSGGLKGRTFSIISGTGAGQDRIISNSSVTAGVMILTFSSALEVTGDNTSVWVITRGRQPSLDSSLRPSVLDSTGNVFIAENVDHSLNCAYRISSTGTITTYTASANTDLARGVALVAARDAASSGDLIRVYASAVVEESLAKNGVNWWFADGVTITNSSDANIWDISSAMTFTVTGKAKFSVSGDAHVLYGNQNGGPIRIECESMYSANDVIDKDGGTVTIECNRIEAGGAVANYGMDLTIECPSIVASIVHGTITDIGTTRIIGAVIDSSAQALPTVNASVDGVILENCKLVTKATETNSIAGGPSTLTVVGTLDYNKAVDSDVTLAYVDVTASNAGAGDATLANQTLILAQVNKITTQRVEVIDYINGNSVTVVKGETYSSSLNPLTFMLASGDSWPTDLTSYTITLTATQTEDENGNPPDTAATISQGGSVVVATGDTRAVRVDFTAAQSALLTAGLYDYKLKAVNGSITDYLRQGQLRVIG